MKLSWESSPIGGERRTAIRTLKLDGHEVMAIVCGRAYSTRVFTLVRNRAGLTIEKRERETEQEKEQEDTLGLYLA